jgi:hypothetical protein
MQLRHALADSDQGIDCARIRLASIESQPVSIKTMEFQLAHTPSCLLAVLHQIIQRFAHNSPRARL